MRRILTFRPSSSTMTTDKTIELTRIAARDGGARLSFSVKFTEGGASTTQVLTAFASRVAHLPRVGALTEEALEALTSEDAYTKALDMGLRVLGASSLSRAQLVQRLTAKGVKRTLAAEVADELWARGFGNEQEGALSVARRDLQKLWGDPPIPPQLQKAAACRRKRAVPLVAKAARPQSRGDLSGKRTPHASCDQLLHQLCARK